jgi:hypothetical protein
MLHGKWRGNYERKEEDMNIAKYLLSGIPWQADGEAGAGDSAGDDAAALAAAEAAVAAGNVGDASGGAGEAGDAGEAGGDIAAAKAAEQAAAAATQAAAAAKAKGQKAPKWALERLAEETRAKQALAVELEHERAEKRRLAELTERLQAAGKDGKDGAAAAATKPPVPAIPAERFDAEVQRRAEQLLFTQDCNAVAAAGHAAFPDFGETLGILNAVGATSDEFLQDIIATDKAAAPALMRELAANPERAKQLVTMSSRQRVAELVRMSIPLGRNKASVPSVGNVLSRAPTPKAAVSGQASRDEGGLNDTIGDEEFSRRWDDKFLRPARANGAVA